MALALALSFCPVAAWPQAEEPPPDDAETAPDAEVDVELEPEAAGGAIAPPAGVEVIRVKGRAVTAIETDVPASVTQFDAAALEALGAQDVSDLAKVTPNIEIKTAGATAPTFFIRGVGLSDFNANAAGAVSVYQDDVAINAPAIQLPLLFDLENVEVLRGPQGSGSGRNASAGAIKIYSRKPTGERTAELRSTWGRFNLLDFEGALELPIVEEVLASRFAFRYLQRDPWVENGCGGAPPLDERVVRPPVRDVYVGDDLFMKGVPQTIPTDPRWSLCDEQVPVTSATRAIGQYPPSDPRINQLNQPGISPIPPGLPDEVNDAGNWAARGQIRFQPPGTEMDWLINAHGGRLDQMSTLGQAIGTGQGNTSFFGAATRAGYRDRDIVEMQADITAKLNEQFPDLSDNEISDLARQELADELARNLDIRPYRGDYNRVGQTRLDTWGSFLRGDWSIGAVDFTTISDYETYERFREQDQDFTPDRLFEAISQDEAWQFSQELRLGGELREYPFRWEAGGYYLMEQLESNQDSFLRQSFLDINRAYEQDLWSFGVYTGFEWDFLDDFTVDGGVRYNWERKTFDYTLTYINLAVAPSRVAASATWQAPTGSIRFAYRFGEDTSVYWKYSRGWKGGHFNAVAQKIENLEPVEPETIDAFEVGLKGNWFDGRIGLGLSLFYYSYTDYQVFIVESGVGAPPTYQIVNANDAEVYGGELEFRAEPLDGLVLEGKFGWLESQFLDFTNDLYASVAAFDANGKPVEKNLPVTVNYSGNRLINSPQFKASFAAEWTVDLGRWGAVIPRYDFAWSDDIFFDPSAGLGSLNARGETVLPEYAVGQRAFWLHNAQLTYRSPEGNIEVTGWVRNFMDKSYKTFAFDASVFSDVVINFVGEPRTYGVTLSIVW